MFFVPFFFLAPGGENMTTTSKMHFVLLLLFSAQKNQQTGEKKNSFWACPFGQVASMMMSSHVIISPLTELQIYPPPPPNKQLSSFKGASHPHLFLFTQESLAMMFFFILEYVEMKEISVKKLKITKHTFGNTTYSKPIKISLDHEISIILMASEVAAAD